MAAVLRRVASGCLALLAGCAAPTNPAVENWGTVHEALGQGLSQARVALARVAEPGFYGVGALEALAGEVTVADGVVWISRGAGQPTTKSESLTDARATLLFGSRIATWKPVVLDRDVTADELPGFVEALAKQHGLDVERPFVFRADGELRDLTLHVIAGECPMRAKMLGKELEHPPFKTSYEQVRGQLVGIYAAKGGGTFSHHGQTTHIHVILDEARPLTGHVEQVGLARGTTVFLPLP